MERSGLAGHHFVNVPLAHKDGKDPDTLNKGNLKSLLVHSSKLELENELLKACKPQTWHMLSVSVTMNTFGLMRCDRAKARISKYQAIPMPRKRRTKITIWSLVLDRPSPLAELLLREKR